MELPKRKAYPSDLTDREWNLLEPLLPAPQREPRWPRREIVNAILYRLRTGCPWRHLPHDFPPWSTVADLFRQWSYAGGLARIQRTLRERERVAAGCHPEPRTAVLDTQSAKTTEQGGPRGFDAGKKVKGRKRHLLVDTAGRLLAVRVHPANIQDPAGGRLFFAGLPPGAFPRLTRVFVDGIYRGPLRDELRRSRGIEMEVVPRIADRGFVPVAHRWVVERTFGWLNRDRLLAKEYGRSCRFSEALIQLAAARISLRRLAQIT